MSNAKTYIAHRRESDGKIQTVEEHLLGVAGLASAFASKIHLGPHGELLGMLHDLGKYATGFQSYFEEERDGAGKVDHSTAGAQLIWRELCTKGDMAAAVGQLLALCIASHHGGPIDCLTPEGEDRFGVRMQKDDASSHLQEAIVKADRDILTRVHQISSDPSLTERLGGAMKAIHDQEKSVAASGKDIRLWFMAGLLLRMLFSCLIDADRTDTADFDKPDQAQMRLRGDYASWDVLIDRLEHHLAGFEDRCPIDRIRKQVSEQCLGAFARPKGVFTLTVPTGGGKTFASLRFALHHARKWQHDRIIYVVPYTTIIDQNAQSARDVLEPKEAAGGFGSVVLEHHSNLTPEEETPRTQILSENWDARIIYTTMVQLLESLFAGGTQAARRMHQLSNAVIVFDEIQALPIHTVHLVCNALTFLADHCGSTVVLCTATQPLLTEVDKSKGAVRLRDDSELMQNVNTLFDDLKRVEVVDRRRPGGWDDPQVAELARESIAASGSCLVIVNTKKAALSLYRPCKAHEPAAEVYHLSTNMCPAHRMKVLDKIGKRVGKKGKPPEEPGPLLCISTQLIEAGVDVDFGSVVRYVAGLDSIAQAAGRCNRHGRRDKGVVTIVNPADEDLRHLEDIRVGRDAAIRVLEEFADDPESFNRDLLSPKAMERYFRYYFFERKHLMDYPVSGERDDTLLNMLSVNPNAVGEYRRRNGKWPDKYWRQSFMAAAQSFKAIDSPTQGVVVPYGDEGQEVIADLCAASDIGELRQLLRKAQRYSVNVFPWVLRQLQDAGAVYEVQQGAGILHLDPKHYSKEFGLSVDPVSEQPFLNA